MTPITIKLTKDVVFRGPRGLPVRIYLKGQVIDAEKCGNAVNVPEGALWPDEYVIIA